MHLRFNFDACPSGPCIWRNKISAQVHIIILCGITICLLFAKTKKEKNKQTNKKHVLFFSIDDHINGNFILLNYIHL